jgi:hypothetical protein
MGGVILNRFTTISAFLAVALWLGSGFYFDAFAAQELFAALPQDTAGQAVGALFPTFFALCTILSAITLVFYVLVGRAAKARGWVYQTGLWAAVTGFVLCAVNQFVLLPKIEAIRAKMGPVSTAADALRKQFYAVHGLSMLVELLSLIAALLVFLTMAGSVRWSWNGKGE